MIKLIKSTFYEEGLTKRALAKFINVAEQLSFGKECEKFEKKLALFQGRKHAVFVNSGSSANLAIVQTLLNLGLLTKGDRVGFSAVTWSTNVMPLIELGLKPVPVDVELNTLNISSRILAKASKKHKLQALFLTNVLGFCDDVDEIARLCKRNNILLIEDNCEAMGSVYKGKKLGNFGVASTFSFFVGHHLSTVEGGAVCTDDDEIASMLRMVRAHGWDRNLSSYHQKKFRRRAGVESSFYAKYTFYDLGYNLRPTEIQGFLGNFQMRYIESILKRRQDNFLKMAHGIYGNMLKYLPIRYHHMDFISNFTFPVLCRSGRIKEDLIKKCAGRIEIRPIIAGDTTRQPFFRKYAPEFSNSLETPNSKFVHENGLYFGNNPEMEEKEIKEIINVFSK